MNYKPPIIAVVGSGIMGSGIISNFLKQGYKVYVWNRARNKLTALVAQGAIAADTPKEAAAQADIVFEVTANDESSRSVWLGESGILTGARSGTILITSATLSINWVDELISHCQQNKHIFFDMPLTGGRVGAENGTLTLLVGGDEAELKKIEPTLSAISEKRIYFGKAGSGMRYKLLLNTLQAIHIIAFGEVLEIARQSGLDIKIVGDALADRPGGTTTKLAWRDYQAEPNPINFSIDWITKDLRYSKIFADKAPTPLLNEALSRYEKAVENNLGSKDWTVINKTR